MRVGLALPAELFPFGEPCVGLTKLLLPPSAQSARQEEPVLVARCRSTDEPEQLQTRLPQE